MQPRGSSWEQLKHARFSCLCRKELSIAFRIMIICCFEIRHRFNTGIFERIWIRSQRKRHKSSHRLHRSNRPQARKTASKAFTGNCRTVYDFWLLRRGWISCEKYGPRTQVVQIVHLLIFVKKISWHANTIKIGVSVKCQEAVNYSILPFSL